LKEQFLEHNNLQCAITSPLRSVSSSFTRQQAETYAIIRTKWQKHW